MLRWAILASAIWLVAACGSTGEGTTGAGGTAGEAGTTGAGGSTAGAGRAGSSMVGGAAGSGGADVPVCDGLPRDGSACSPNGRKCQTAGSPCGGIHTCQNGAWSSQTVCPPTQMCPQDLPEQGAACTVDNPVSGLTCQYESGCGQVSATCNEPRWELAPNSVTECHALCDDVCQRLTDCGIAWSRDCPALCGVAYLCPGESPGQDAAICTSEETRLADLDCPELCSAVSDGAGTAAFGVDCDLMPQ